MNIFSNLLIVGVGVVVHGCSTSGPGYLREFEPSRVVERIGGASDTPEWASGAKPVFLDGADIVHVSTITMSGDARPEACNRAAADTGRVDILRVIRDNLTSSGQLSEVSATSDPATESLLAFLSQGKLSGVKVVGRYWERREESDSNGLRVLRIHCASKVAIQRGLLESQMRDAMNGSGVGSPEIREKLLDAQKKFLDSVESGGGDSNKNLTLPTTTAGKSLPNSEATDDIN